MHHSSLYPVQQQIIITDVLYPLIYKRNSASPMSVSTAMSLTSSSLHAKSVFNKLKRKKKMMIRISWKRDRYSFSLLFVKDCGDFVTNKCLDHSLDCPKLCSIFLSSPTRSPGISTQKHRKEIEECEKTETLQSVDLTVSPLSH